MSKAVRYREKLANKRKILIRKATKLKEEIRLFQELAEAERDEMRTMFNAVQATMDDIDGILNKRFRLGEDHE